MTSRTSVPAPVGLTRADLANFLGAHLGFRIEYARLAEACRNVRDADHAELIESQIAFVLDVLHHHHTVEDELVWPMLLARVPDAGPVLERLEAEHEHLDPVIRRAGDTTVPLAERAETLQQLSDALNRHLDGEERDAVPLIQAHLGHADWQQVEKRAAQGIGRSRVPLLYGWFVSAADDELRELSAQGVPLVVEWLFRLFWWPSYRRRFDRLYGHAELLPSI
jgi:Hemerythrin HHE cation binding domain